MGSAGFGAWVALSVLLIVTPGPDTALVVANALRGGRRLASATVFGIAAGTLAWSLAAAYGAGLLLERSEAAFTALRLAGAAYLVYLGLRALLARRPVAPSTAGAVEPPLGRGFRQGLLSNLTNAKTGAFFVSVLPQFLGPGVPAWRLTAMLAVYQAVLLAWLHLYAAGVARAGRSRLGARIREVMARITGAVLVGLGVRLALERR